MFTAKQSVRHGRVIPAKDYLLVANAFYYYCDLLHNLIKEPQESALKLLDAAKIVQIKVKNF